LLIAVLLSQYTSSPACSQVELVALVNKLGHPDVAGTA
jgi:hypothetical protein